jgi:HlyD family secretion protein
VRLGFLVIAILAVGLGWLWWFQHRSTAVPGWQGYADADYVKVAPVEEGRLLAISVARGDVVAKGAPLFTEDDTEERAARDQAARQLAQAEQQLANLEAGAKPMEVVEAEANVADAQSTLGKARADLGRDEALLKSGYATAQIVDQRRADYLSAKAKAEHAAAALADARGPMGRQREIDAQRAAVAAARAALAMAQWRLDQRTVTAPIAGRIADVLAQPGETMAAGAPVVSILPRENIFVRFFVPETALSSLHPGDPVAFECDGCPPSLVGTISFISPTAEYTPPVIYSEATRDKLVYLIEARPRADQAALINPGQPMEVRPLAMTERQ